MSGRSHTAVNRTRLQPRLVHLISGLRVHQVEEAVQLLLDYVDQAASPATPNPAPRSSIHRAKPIEIMPMALCEAAKLVLRPGQPYVFTPDPGCASCEADLDQAKEAYGIEAVAQWLADAGASHVRRSVVASGEIP